ncbi:MAG: glycosyltransferase [bacterium]
MADGAERPLVIIGLPTWEGPYEKAIVQLARRLARRRRVVYVEYAPTWIDVARANIGHGPKHGAFQWRQMVTSRLRPAAESPAPGVLSVLTPPSLMPINGMPEGPLYESVRRVNERIVRTSLHRALRRLKINEFDIINAFSPQIGTGRPGGWWGETMRFYYSYDDIGGMPWNARHGVRLEKQYMRECGGIITTSSELARRARQLNNRVEFVPNGADTALFAQALENGPLAADILPLLGGAIPASPRAGAGTIGGVQSVARHIIGFIGSIDSRVDVDMLCHAAKLRPQYIFMFIGPTVLAEAGLLTLRQLPNTVFTGPRKPTDLPDYVRAFSAGIIPFVRNRFTECVYPIKVNEYLAAGLPVARTDFAQLDGFDEVAMTVPCADAKAFAAALDMAVSTYGDTALLQKRLQIAKTADWDVRAQTFGDILMKWASP